jgi:MurNAc alpha-1-phosphate uridylyltransferase
MVNVAGESIIKRSIKKIHQAGVQKIVVNVHHLGGLLKEHLKDINAPQIICSDEEELLETGGGIKKALSHFSGPFFIINGDALWEDGPVPALSRLAEAWDEIRMDILLLLQPKSAMPLTQGAGDYRMLADGQARRAHDKNGDYMFAGIRIAHPRIFDGSPDTAFSFLTLMDKAEREGRLFALVHDGAWHHISAPEDLAAVNRHFEGTAL